MPNGRTHDVITVVTAAVATPVVLTSSLPEIGTVTAAVLVGTYLASWLIFSPDLDLQSRPYRRWGPLRFIWIPYQKMIPHRSWISHSFIFGPLIRVVYFALMVTLLYLGGMALINLFTPIDSTGTLLKISRTVTGWVGTHPTIISYALAGLVIGGASHTLADIVYSWVKRKMKRLL
jgi:uncharacterized metal-binding protein